MNAPTAQTEPVFAPVQAPAYNGARTVQGRPRAVRAPL